MASEPEGGAAGIGPQPPLGGTGGAAGSSATAGAGGSLVGPPEQGMAGEPNIPDPPVDPKRAAPVAEPWTAELDSTGGLFDASVQAAFDD